MAPRGRLLLAGALSALLLACQSASAASPSQPAPATGPTGQAAARPAASSNPAAASQPVSAAKPPAVQQSDAAPRIRLEALPFGFRQPLFLTHAGDGRGRQFVVEKGGAIRIVKGGQLVPTPFLDIQARVRASGSEQGLLGLAFHPRYAENGRFFVAYTDSSGRNTVERYQVSSDPDRGDPSTGVTLLSIDDPAQNHNGGMLTFGPDGMLWVGTGDGGGSGDRYGNGQNRQTLLGKMLRLDVDSGEPYGIPADNPFVGQPEYRPEIWAMGLRNPWRYTFDRATGDLWIADVGQNAYEEIDLVTAGTAGGLNFGWPLMEGMHCFPESASCDQTPYVRPVAEYGRGGGCSVTGGYVYRGSASPSLQGLYFFGDFCTGRVWSLDRQGDGWRMTEQLQQAIQISSFGEDEAGEVYLTTFSGGDGSHQIYRIVAQ
ncbi:MAG: PQQ-dependent sugar dehydrogenase [Chloroflexi bacterium]|nr:PQQ-dependent sugar dehydrogenase [Chloroflexota bacterium]